MIIINLLSKTIVIADLPKFLLSIFMMVLFTRILLNIFKATAIRQGEADSKENKFSDWGKWEAFWKSFFSWGHHKNIDDYYLPSIIGGIELFMYPFLMFLEQWVFIAMLIGLKTAVHWGKWQEVRTAYNRFLLGNLLVVVSSLFIMISFLKVEVDHKEEEIKPITTQSTGHDSAPNSTSSAQ